MRVPADLIKRLSRSVQPLVFETGLEDFPYSTTGTVFLVGFHGQSFVLTTRHGLRPETLGPICVFPSDHSLSLIPLRDVFFVPEAEEPEDFMDLAVIAIDTMKIASAEVAHASLIDLALASGEWESKVANSDLFVIGYPADHAFIEDDLQTLHTERVTLNARYIGKSALPYLHEVEVTDSHALTTFSGLSGSPVFSLIRHPNSRSTIVLCGMAIRGTHTSNRIHFLDRSVLIDALTIKLSKQSDV